MTNTFRKSIVRIISVIGYLIAILMFISAIYFRQGFDMYLKAIVIGLVTYIFSMSILSDNDPYLKTQLRFNLMHIFLIISLLISVLGSLSAMLLAQDINSLIQYAFLGVFAFAVYKSVLNGFKSNQRK